MSGRDQPLRPIHGIGDLPFRLRPLLELLALDGDRDSIDVDYAGFGWARARHLWLADASGARRVDDALILALHSADDGPPIADDLELEFTLPHQSFTVLLSAFLSRWLPRLPTASAIVLAMCNPHRACLGPVPAAGTAVVHYGLGPVDAWLDLDSDGSRVRLAAPAWRQTPRPPSPSAP